MFLNKGDEFFGRHVSNQFVLSIGQPPPPQIVPSKSGNQSNNRYYFGPPIDITCMKMGTELKLRMILTYRSKQIYDIFQTSQANRIGQSDPINT
ncbi:MAG: hypothetical protein ACMUEM_07125 [Flavobacteriales bacterium AspAUS03]